MKKILPILLLILTIAISNFAQNTSNDSNKEKAIYSLIDNYTRSRETKDTVLLQKILMPDVDQLVSSGEWRVGIEAATKGMMQSSTNNPGDRTITVDKIRFINQKSAIVDARYEIQNDNGSVRKMWSTFVVVFEDDMWKISAIRNMLPAG